MAVDRRIERGQATRGQILAAATELFTALGYERTSVEAILERSGASRGALYHHFGTKEAVFEAVLEEAEAMVAERVGAASRGLPSPVAALQAGCRTWLRLAREPTVRQVVLIDAAGVVGWEKWRQIDERFGFGMLKASLSRAARLGLLPAEQVEVTAHLLLAALLEAALLVSRAESEAAATRCEEAVAGLINRLLGAGQPRPG